MKLTTALLLLACLHASAKAYAQTVTLNEKSAPLEKVFREITSQTGYVFFYTDNTLKNVGTVTIKITALPLEQALNKLLAQQPLSYAIVEKNIVIKQKESQPVKTVLSYTMATRQVVDVRGRVLNENDEPLSGATVSVKGKGATTTTNAAGAFELRGTDPDATLVITYVGYKTREVRLNGQASITIKLDVSSTEQEQVIIIGYGQVKKKDVTGSVGKVNITDLEKAPVKSFDDALGGRIAGVRVSSADGQPGSNPEIIIRGGNSLTQDNSPLYVIDGFPIENFNNNSINPLDIESIEVLKDASATAIYGARGANGVIILTTKKGKANTLSITYDASIGAGKRLKKQKLLSPYEFLKYQMEAYPVETAAKYLLNGKTIESYRDVKAIDWEDAILQNAAFQNHSIGIRGGSANTTFSFSGSYINQDGIIINSGFKRYQGRFVLDQNLAPNLRFNFNGNYANTQSYGTKVADYNGNDKTLAVMSSVWGYRPLSSSDSLDILVANLDADINPTTDYRYNPVKNLANAYNTTMEASLIFNANIDYKITPNLTLKILGGVNRVTSQNAIFNNSNTRSGDRNTPQGKYGPNGSIYDLEITNYVNENTLSYNKVWQKAHALNVLGGITYQQRKIFGHGFTANNVPNESLGISGLDEGVPTRIQSSKSQNTLASFLGRVDYNYASRYYLTASFRADGSSKFATGNKWGYFPSGALSWRISKEAFFKPIRFISDAKLRVSYGITGNNRVSDYPYLSTVQLSNGVYSFGSSFVQGTSRSTLGNTDLKWETTAQADVGLDLEFLASRVSVTADYYNKKTYNLLLNAALPGSTGFSSTFQNIGKIKNEGVEFSLNTVNIQKTGFTWRTGFNISFNRSKVLELVDGQESILSVVSWDATGFGNVPVYYAKKGQPVGQIFGYVFDGLYQYSDFYTAPNGSLMLKPDVVGNTGTRTGIQPGNAKYKDLNGDGVLDSKDQEVIGRGAPIHTGGFTNSIVYKNFDLNFLLQWSYGNNLVNANRIYFEASKKLNFNQFASVANRWSPTNQSSTIPIPVGTNGADFTYSSRIIEDGSYVRLKTVQLAYVIPKKFLRAVKINSIRLYASAQNLLTFTKYSGIDPEVSTYNSPLTPGFDYSAYPRARTTTIGINVSF